jgi:hypothetical protein
VTAIAIKEIYTNISKALEYREKMAVDQQKILDEQAKAIENLKMPDNEKMSEIHKSCSTNAQKVYYHAGIAAETAREFPGASGGGPLTFP